MARLFPQLCLRDPVAGAGALQRVFGFRAETPARLRLGSQIVEVAAGDSQHGHGLIDHLALGVDDVGVALAQAMARGGTLCDVTPEGPRFIPEFWAQGARYVFLDGPEGARVELCARPGVTRQGLPGQDHVGIACRDLPGMRAFLLSLGLDQIAATVLERPQGNVAVCFLGIGGSTVELYTPPGLPDAPRPPGFWRRLVLEGAATAGPITGPEGIEVLRRL
jgi:catechol 2,3-dioxygenase-like lactoylglutathione lyase family enzyme